MKQHATPGAVSARTRWSYGLGCIGRDAAYTLVNSFLLTYLTMAVGLTEWQLGAVGVVMIVARVWDAINDPMMGTIIDNTRSRFGKFKPYIICGALLNSIFTILLFSQKAPRGDMLFVLIFAITYILWGMTYTMNDISYWGMLPSLTSNPKQRERLTTIARIGANIGLFSVTALVPIITAGGMASLYQPIAIVVALVFIACQLLVVFGVQENKSAISSSGVIRLRDMAKIIFKNDQLLVIAVAILLFNIGYFTTTSFGVQFFYFDYKSFGGAEFTIFAAAIGVAQIATLALYPLIAKRLRRRQQFTLGIVLVVIGYAGFMAVGFLLPMNMVVLCAIGFVLFAGQAFVQLLNYILLADTVEYGQWKLGTRNEGIIYSLNPFITKLASAVQAGIFSATMIISGLNGYSYQISQLENELNTAGESAGTLREQLISRGNEIVATVPESSTLIMRASMIILPLMLILACYIIYRTRYKLDEETYAKIVSDLEERSTNQANKV